MALQSVDVDNLHIDKVYIILKYKLIQIMKKSQTIKSLNFQFALDIPKLKNAYSKDWDSSLKLSQISVKQELSRLSEHSVLTSCDK